MRRLSRVSVLSLTALIVLLSLAGCQKKITTFDAVIKDGYAEIDGISYEIKGESKAEYTYDENGNVIVAIWENDDFETRTEHTYESNKLVKSKSFSESKSSGVAHESTRYFYYEEDNLIKIITKTEKFETLTEYSYDDHTKSSVNYNPDGNVSFTSTATLDDEGNILSLKSFTSDGELISFATNYYKDGVIISTNNYEYNNLGDKIMDYAVFSGNTSAINVKLIEYVYNEEDKPISSTVFQTGGKIEEENIREY